MTLVSGKRFDVLPWRVDDCDRWMQECRERLARAYEVGGVR
jgi:hypothetical protein